MDVCFIPSLSDAELLPPSPPPLDVIDKVAEAILNAIEQHGALGLSHQLTDGESSYTVVYNV